MTGEEGKEGQVKSLMKVRTEYSEGKGNSTY